MSRLPILLALFVSSPAIAAQDTVTFNATINATCTILVESNGTMSVDTNMQNLSSKNVGGTPGRVTITTTGGVNFSVDGSPIVTPPGTDTTATTWTPTYESSGLLALAERTNATAITIPGSHTLDVHLTGVKSGSDTFGAGVYAGTVIVRCE